MTGLTLAQYRIDAEIGRGGMGIVYRATDTKLNRVVALKVLPASALSSQDDRARFFREAQAAAQLHHPNIATVFQIDEAIPVDADGVQVQAGDGPRPFIAMEFVEGETLQEAIRKSPVSLPLAANIAGQIAEALKEAHAKNIVHRDIKSANVMIAGSGVAKVLDFGLAKTNQSTMITRMGSTLGTVAYMSPEQARGMEVDGRTDLYALGTVLYEMIAGRLPFEGDYEQAVLYAILNEPPEPLTALRTGVPMELERIVGKLLAKEAEYRYQTAADLLADLKSLHLGGSGVSRRSMAAASAARIETTAGTAAAGTTSPRWIWPAVVVAVAFGAVAGWLGRPSSTDGEPVRRFEIILDGVEIPALFRSAGDGRYWAFHAFDSLGTRGTYLYDLAEGTYGPVPGLERHLPAGFSPSGQWLMTRLDGGTFRTRIPTGRPIAVDSTRFVAWITDDEVLVSRNDDSTRTTSFERLSVETRQRTPVPVPAEGPFQGNFVVSEVLPGGTIAIGTVQRGQGSFGLAMLELETGKVTMLLEQARAGFAFRDWIIYALEEGDLLQIVAQRFDPGARELRGIPIDLASRVDRLALIGVMSDDALLRTIEDAGIGAGDSFSWFDPERRTTEGLALPIARYDRFSFSPDGTEIAVERTSDAGTNIYVVDLETGTERRLTYDVEVNRAPSWSRSGKIYFAGGPVAQSSIYVKNADGSGAAEQIVEQGDYPEISADGKWLVFSRLTRGQDIYALNVETGEEVAIDDGDLRANDATISPDGRFVAYSISPDVNSTTVGTSQHVVVRSFPDPERQYVQVSEEQADDPKWSPDGYLYMRNLGVFSRIRVDTRDTFQPLSSREIVGSFPGGEVRSAFNPVDGRLLVEHASGLGTSSGSARVSVLLGFERYLEEASGR